MSPDTEKTLINLSKEAVNVLLEEARKAVLEEAGKAPTPLDEWWRGYTAGITDALSVLKRLKYPTT